MLGNRRAVCSGKPCVRIETIAHIGGHLPPTRSPFPNSRNHGPAYHFRKGLSMPPRQPIEPMQQPKQPRDWRAALIGLVGITAAGLLYTHVPEDEGMVYKGYRDISGVPTKCAGDTRGVVVGRAYTKAECEQSLGRALYTHAEPMLRCIPTLRNGAGQVRPYETYAIISLAYNVGVDAACRSTAANQFRARNWRAGCQALRRWVYDNGRRIRGLELRRDREIQRCLRGEA